MLKRLVAVSLLLHLSLQPILAQPQSPTARPAPEKLGVLTIDSEQHWDSDTQQHWQPPVETGAVSDLGRLLRPSAVRSLSLQQRKVLLREPARLLASDRAAEIFAVDRVLLLEPAVEDRVLAHYHSLTSGMYRRLLSGPRQSADDGRRELLILAGQDYGPGSVAVFANPESMIYHQLDARHVNPQARREEFASFFQAEEKGYSACAVCFAGRNRSLSQDTLEKELGRVLAARMEGAYRRCLDGPTIERVERVGRALLEKNRLQQYNYRFVVLDSEDINAFAVPTGPVYITNGLLSVVESDAELAAILGHELAHCELHHGRRQYEQEQQLSWLALLATMATGTGWAYSAASFLGLLTTRGYSRDFELEADRQGLWYTYGAGYQPADFKMTLHKFLDLEKRRPQASFNWLRTHPGNQARLEEVDHMLERLEPLGLVVEEIEPLDGGLAAYLRVHGSHFLENPEEVVEFLQAYRGMNLPARAATAPKAPPLPDGKLPELK